MNMNASASSLNCAVLFERIGPYHFARLSALGRQTRTRAVELFGMDATYAWDKVTGEGGFERETLFENPDAALGDPELINGRVSDALDRSAPALVAIPGWAGTAAFAALSWCLRTGTPAVVMSASTAVDEPRRWWKESLKGQVVRLFSAGLGGGTPHLEYLAALGIPRERLFPGYDVVDNEHFARGADAARADAHATRTRLGLPENYFVASNRFVEKKNLPRLLSAYAAYRRAAGRSAWKLVLLGGGPLERQVRAQRDTLGLSEDVLMPGFKQYGDLPAYYGLAGAFVHASTAEQWGLVVNEAMASGLPVLVSDHCGCATDLVDNLRNGFTFDPTNVEALAALFLRISTGELDLAAMGHASREMIARWSPQTFATNLCRAGRAAQAIQRPRATLASRAVLSALLSRPHYP
jgi:hypothetical protein